MSTDEFPKAHCVRCGYTWLKRVPRPTVCPNCQSRDWDIPFKRQPKPVPSAQDTLEAIDALRRKLRR